MTAYRPARLAGRADAGGGLAIVDIEVPRGLAATYEHEGQYVEVRAQGETGLFVLASEPAARWQLIMRAGGGVSDRLLAMPIGSPVEVTAAIGTGFPMGEARGRRLVVALGGTGVAAARPIVRRRMADGDAALTALFVGARVRAEVPLSDDFDAWRGRGVDVTVCLSQDQAPGVAGLAAGYVQDVIRERRAAQGALIFAVGPSPMVAALRALASAGVYTNH